MLLMDASWSLPSQHESIIDAVATGGDELGVVTISADKETV